MANGNPATANDFFGHPRGLSTLFFTELWERFSYYGMRALLVLFMTAEALGDNPGLGFSVGEATAIYGIYTFLYMYFRFRAAGLPIISGDRKKLFLWVVVSSQPVTSVWLYPPPPFSLSAWPL